jgi:hypothetical protein
MHRNRFLFAGSVMVAAWMSTGLALGQSSGSRGSDAIYPDASGPKGGSRSERTGESDVPLPKGSPSAGTVEKGQSTDLNSPRAQSKSSDSGQTIHPPASGSKGGSQSERTRETGVPLPQGSPYSGTVEKGQSGEQHSMAKIREAQQALKDKGYDPGPIDGVMGTRTKEAIKSFQNASNLQATGTLDAQTAQQLGVQSGSGATSSEKMPTSGSSRSGTDSGQSNMPAANR